MHKLPVHTTVLCSQSWRVECTLHVPVCSLHSKLPWVELRHERCCVDRTHVLLLLLGGAAASGATIPALMGTTFSLWGAQNALKRLLEYSLSTPRAKRLSYYNATFRSRVHDLHTRWLMWLTFHIYALEMASRI